MSLVRGSLDQTSLPALLRPLIRERRTGVLRLNRGAVTKTIYVSGGRLIFATSTDPDDRLGEMLLAKGVITYRALEESVLAIKVGKRQGTILVESGAIRSRDLISGVTEQVQEIVYSVFRWDMGTFEFVEGDLPSREVIVLRMSTGDLLLEGIRRIQAWSRIRGGVGALDQRYALSHDYRALLAGLVLEKHELGLVATLVGEATVEEICAANALSDFVVCRTIWGLWAAGVLDKIPEDRQALGAAVRLPRRDLVGQGAGGFGGPGDRPFQRAPPACVRPRDLPAPGRCPRILRKRGRPDPLGVGCRLRGGRHRRRGQPRCGRPSPQHRDG